MADCAPVGSRLEREAQGQRSARQLSDHAQTVTLNCRLSVQPFVIHEVLIAYFENLRPLSSILLTSRPIRPPNAIRKDDGIATRALPIQEVGARFSNFHQNQVAPSRSSMRIREIEFQKTVLSLDDAPVSCPRCPGRWRVPRIRTIAL